MKEFSGSWKSSKQKRKQRKYRLNAPLHIKKRFLNVNLAKKLRKEHGIRSLSPRKGDQVKILRGKFRKHTGKVTRIDVKDTKVFVEGAETIKKDGTKTFYPLEPSNLQLVDITLKEKYRKKTLERKNVKKTSEKV